MASDKPVKGEAQFAALPWRRRAAGGIEGKSVV